MKRTLATVAWTLILSLPALAGVLPPVTHHGGGSSASERSYVLVEITGLDATANIYAKPEDVKARQDQVNKDNAERAKENKAIDAEVSKMTADLTARNAKLASTKDETAKAELQKDIETLKAEIVQKKESKKLLTSMPAPKQFNTRTDADKFIEQVYKDSMAVKEKADAAREKAQAAREKAEAAAKAKAEAKTAADKTTDANKDADTNK